MKKSLYELSEDLERLAWALEESGGEITEEIDAALSDTEQAVSEKIANYIALIKNFEAIAAAKKAEKQRLGNSQKADENIVAKLRARLVWFFERNDLKQQRTRLGTVTLSANPPIKKPELLVDESQVPDRYIQERQEIIREIDYDLIRQDLENGVEIKWARLPERKNHITIK